MKFVIPEAANVQHAIGSGEGAMAIHAALFPVSGQYVAVGQGEGALAVELIVLELARIGSAIGRAPAPFTVPFALFPVALVAATVGIPGGAGTIKFAVHEVAFITQPGAVFPGAVAGGDAAAPFTILVAYRGEGFQFADQREFVAGLQCHGIAPGLVSGLFDSDVIAAGIQLKVQPGGAIGFAVDRNLIAHDVRAQHQGSGPGGLRRGFCCRHVALGLHGRNRFGHGQHFGILRHWLNGERFARCRRCFGLLAGGRLGAGDGLGRLRSVCRWCLTGIGKQWFFCRSCGRFGFNPGRGRIHWGGFRRRGMCHGLRQSQSRSCGVGGDQILANRCKSGGNQKHECKCVDEQQRPEIDHDKTS